MCDRPLCHLDFLCLVALLYDLTEQRAPAGEQPMHHEHDSHEVRCRNCGNLGLVDLWIDDWYRWHAVWIGFKGDRIFDLRERAEASCLRCGSNDVAIGMALETRDTRYWG